MTKTRWIGLMAAAGAVAALTGCVAPGPYYGDGYGGGDYVGGGGYSQPYYADPTVVAPPVFLGIGVDSSPRYYDRGSYYGRPGYYHGGRPGYAPRPGYGPRPSYGDNRGYQGRPQVGRPGILPIPRPQARGSAAQPAPIFKPSPAPGVPGVIYQPSWNNKEQP